ncbi:histidine phosphatase family protein [Nonomuraea jiangxiensis]|uniref:Probable phosphoglycerate mutase n=1 Tax=Nonomuraea jiangxiensis TaxID=633440 RepID=A0A1G8LGA1_9ACTN|nr:histidine phosphatase family protein [Nonomuraea jiangxiensis]SDI54527.1 probable phosphoglycerate mutase [Nonomuraea jiangxiensis]
MTRYLYLTRHGEASPDGHGLTAAGRRQAALLGERLRDVPFTAVHHSPVGRAAETARLIGEHLPGVPLHACEAAGDYVPYVPTREELSPEHADRLLDFVHQFPDHEQGAALARQALDLFTGPAAEGTAHELVVTHNFLVGWLVRAALDAPEWRWLGVNHCNAALTVIRYAPDRPSSVLLFNDMAHLPAELRWTGFPPELRV